MKGDYLASKPSLSLYGGSNQFGYPMFAEPGKLRIVVRGLEPRESVTVMQDHEIVIKQLNADKKGLAEADLDPTHDARPARCRSLQDRWRHAKALDRSFYFTVPSDK